MLSDMIKAADILTTGTRLRLHPEKSDGLYPGKIESITPAHLSIAMNLPAALYLSLPLLNEPIHCQLTGGRGLYLFTTPYQGKTPLPQQLWRVEAPELIERQQQRRFVRVPVPLPLEVRSASTPPQKTITIDISGNGVCFVCAKEVPIASIVGICIDDLPQFGQLQITAEVIRCTPVCVPAGIIYHVGVYMGSTLTAQAQERLVHCLFHLQRIYLQKGIRS